MRTLHSKTDRAVKYEGPSLFDEVDEQKSNPLAAEAVRYIATLYTLEENLRAAGASAEPKTMPSYTLLCSPATISASIPITG